MGFSPILQGVSVAAPFVGGQMQAQAARQQGSAAAQAARYNAALAREESSAEAGRLRRAGRRELGRQRAAIGASGVQAEGSPLELLAQNAYEIEREAAQTELAGRRTARLDLAQARSAERAGRMGAGTARLSGALGSGLALGRVLGGRY